MAELAYAGGAEPLTDALAQWTTRLWLSTALAAETPTVTVYIDGHRKAVYTDAHIPPTYAHATWKRLEPFFKLPGHVVWEADCVRVSVRPFDDQLLNRDLVALCARVAEMAPRLPDGRQLLLMVGAAHRLILDGSSQ